MVDLAGNRTPSIEQSCLPETTDCPSDVSVITSISCMPRVQATTSPLSNTSPRGEESLASRLAQGGSAAAPGPRGELGRHLRELQHVRLARHGQQDLRW